MDTDQGTLFFLVGGYAIRVHPCYPWFVYHWKPRPQGALDPMALMKGTGFFQMGGMIRILALATRSE